MLPSMVDKGQDSSSIIMYELNEVPWAIIDWYVARKPESNIACILGCSRSYTTNSTDQGELHPWVTWPTLHRGVNNTVHGIEFLNQDLTEASAFPPLWETAAAAGKKVGVFGSLQSYPVPQNQTYAFYVPDTFAPKPDAYPAKYEALQELNLRQTASDGGIVSSVKIDRSVFSNVVRLFRVGLSIRTVFRIAKQLMRERINPAYKTRRAVFQAPIAFDVFLHAFKNNPPQLSTFFSNHVAGMMHRYWKHGLQNNKSDHNPDPVRAGNIEFAMDVADEQIGRLRNLADRTRAQFVILSSMGQAPIERRGGDQLRIEAIDRFVSAIGFHAPYTSQLAMHPDFNFSFEANDHAELFAELVKKVKLPDGRPLAYKVNVSGATVNIGVAQPRSSTGEDFISIADSEKEVPFVQAGLRRFARDIGTAYHIPEGIMIWYDAESKPDMSRSNIDSRAIRSQILAAIGIDEPQSYPNFEKENLVA